MTPQWIKLAAVVAATVCACTALTLARGIGPVVAVAILIVVALAFGEWYRTSTTPATAHTDATVAGPEVDGFQLYWTTEGTTSHVAQAAPQSVNAAN